MNFKMRFLLLIALNVGVLFLMFTLFFNSNIDLSSRLVDLNLTDMDSRKFFLEFIGVLLVGFGANFVVGLGKNELTKKEIEAIAEVLGNH